MKLLSLSIIILGAFIGMAGGAIARAQGYYGGQEVQQMGTIVGLVCFIWYIVAYVNLKNSDRPQD